MSSMKMTWAFVFPVSLGLSTLAHAETHPPQGVIKNGKREGLWREYSDSGRLVSETTYHAGKAEGPTREWGGTGGVISAIGQYHDDLPVGKWTYYVGSALSFTLDLDQHRPVLIHCETGTSFRRRIDATPDRKAIEMQYCVHRGADGKTHRQGPEATWQDTDPDTEPTSSQNVVDDVLEGEWIYRDHGKVVLRGTYKHGSRDGVWQSSPYPGSATTTEIYRDGTRVSGP
jgi:antitoxin component YwqK of YwqJK toxin-antitoxin module